MGCQSCKIYESAYCHLDNNKTEPGFKYVHLVSSNERASWIKSLNVTNIPEEGFQKQYSEQSIVVSHPAFKQIKKDIVRTFPTTHFFKDQNNLHRFENLLKKFAIYFPKIGYTQGLNFLAGYLLLAGFTDTEAFQSLIRITTHEKLMMIGLYEDEFPLNRFYCALFWKLLEMKMPKIAKRLREAEVPDEIWIFQWFISFFLYSFPVHFVKGFWDFIICKKEISMVLIALGLVKCLKKDILSMVNPDQIDFFQYFDKLKEVQFCEEKIDLRKTINYANSIKKHEIAKAMNQIQLPNNTYKMYFGKEMKDGWTNMIKKYQKQRDRFNSNPKLLDYKRDINNIEHMEKLILEKSQLYKSKTQSKYSSMFRTSNFTIDLGTTSQQTYYVWDNSSIHKNNQPVVDPRGIQIKEIEEQQKRIKQVGFKKIHIVDMSMNQSQNQSGNQNQSHYQNQIIHHQVSTYMPQNIKTYVHYYPK